MVKEKGLQEEMQVGVNAYNLYNDFDSVQDVIIEPAKDIMSLLVFNCIIL